MTTFSSHLLSTLPPLPSRGCGPHPRSTLISRGSNQVFSSSVSTPAQLPSPSQGSSRVYYAIHHHLRRSTFCLQGCLPTRRPVRGNTPDHRSAGKRFSLRLSCPTARTTAATISSMWSSCVQRPSHLQSAAWPGCNTWCRSVPRDIESMETSFLILGWTGQRTVEMMTLKRQRDSLLLRLDEDGGCSRRTRLLRLCSYLQEKYKHMCRQERARIRQKRYRYVFRKALLHAASSNPDCAGQLMQELNGGSHTATCLSPTRRQSSDPGTCTGNTKGHTCSNRALPFTQHCFQHILLNRSQQLFASCTAKFADGQQCSIPVFDITHQTPLCEEHAKKMDNFLRGDGNRRVQHQQQQRKPRKKTKPPALTKKHKKKRRRGPRRPQKPIPPALPQNLGMPLSSLAMPSHTSVRSPSTPDLSADELPDDITNDITDIPNDLELNHEDFSDVLPRLPDDLQDFDLFEGKNGELLPTTEEAEELVRALQAMGSYPDSLVCLTSIGDLAAADGVDHRAMPVFPGPVQQGGIGDLLNSRIPAENFPSLELEDNLLQSTGDHFPPSPPSQPPNHPPTMSSSSAIAPSTTSLLTQTSLTEHAFSRTKASHVLAKPETSTSSPQSSHYSGEHVSTPPSDHISSPHTSSFTTDTPLLLEVPLSGVPGPPRSMWNNLPLPLTDPTQFGSLIRSESHLISTALSTPPATSHSVALQPMPALSAMPQSAMTGLTAPPTPSSSLPSSSHDLLTSTQPKQQLPQFSAAFGHQLASHSGIPKDVQPSHSSTAPPAGFSIVGATAASANSATPPFTQSK
ncbi:INO80 complex subunit D isoform X2 [Oryzias melastigma]|uniref:INO80 complex subunit D isoform X2 n=1 Tax=Oryzias melastigma TaxID=30732 RepID=UPI00168D80DF|nr:INO80 complex subunit D isoform X2 [Oryzias melastigma]